MTVCPAAQPAPLRCPTLIESIGALVRLLPRGRAWPVNDGGALLARFMAWLAGLNGAIPAEWPAGYVQAGFYAALGALRNYVEQRLCALRLEFWCATMSETRDQWMLEYGLPDNCDPFPDLCTKVAAIGGARCEYFNAVIARMGWSATCFDLSASCGARAGCSRAGARRAIAGNMRQLMLNIVVSLGDPIIVPAAPPHRNNPRAGAFRAGQHPSCDTPSVRSKIPVQCLMERIAPAHATVIYTH